MKKETQGRFSEGGEALGSVTNDVIRQRAIEIAVINGRPAGQVLDTDFEQARRELQGEERLNPSVTAAELVPENERWDPVPGTPGRKVPAVPAADEQNFAEELTEEGVAEAEHDQQLKAAEREKRS